jgi:hypothetical protein
MMLESFIQPFYSDRAASRGEFTRSSSCFGRPKRVRAGTTRRTPVILSVGDVSNYWDETAPDMITFALSGPGWVAAALAVAVAGVFLARFAEFGPQSRSSVFFCLRVSVSRPLRVELPTGVALEIQPNRERILRESRLEAIDAIARNIEQEALRVGSECSYTLYRAEGEILKPLRQFPRVVDAEDAVGWMDGESKSLDDEKNSIWDQYLRLGNYGSVEKEWKSVLENLGGVTRESQDNPNSCKLCGGRGSQRCPRCMGASANGAVVCTKCVKGRVPCAWCANQ